MTTIESILVNFLESYMQDCMVCLPAVVLNVRDAGELRVDCQPISNREFKDGTVSEYPAILSIPVIQPSSGNSAVLMPIKQGDTVLLVFAQRNIDTFKAGSTLPYDPEDRRWMNLQDAVAIAGINPFNKSPNLPSRHKLPHSTEDMVVVHNLGTARECELRLKPNGDMEATGNTLTTKFNNVIHNSDVVVNGVSLTAFINTHAHPYTDDGNPMVTSPALPVGV